MTHPLVAAALTGTALLLGASGASAADLTDMTDAERAAFRGEVRAYLMENPEIIIEAVQALEAKQQGARIEEDSRLIAVNSADIFDDPASWVGGNPEGDVTLVEFIDYRCGYCRKAHGEVAELIGSDGNIRFVLKEFPILGPDSMTAARFAIAVRQVAGDDSYKAVSDALMNLNGELTETALRRLADTLELDADAILARMGDAEVTEIIAQNHALGQRLQINGTPTFVLGDQMLRGYLPLDAMRDVVADVREAG